MPKPNSNHWDIFCDVVDNYGDIGVAWRLAKQLVAEHQTPVKLWVNDLASFKVIFPQLELTTHQFISGVEIINWTEPLAYKWQAGEALIEAFACKLPDNIINELGELVIPPKWINLEYLTAENWIDDCHKLGSVQANGVTRYCFFPGFSEKSGGLLLERDLFAKRDIWQANPNNKANLFKTLNIDNVSAKDLFISYFSYSTVFLENLLRLNFATKLSYKLHIIIPVKDLAKFENRLTSNDNIVLHYVNFTTQEHYDELLWSCDINIVRGEDSFVRAQFAAKPFLWHIYPQDELAHIAKLNAFITRYDNKLENSNNILELWADLNLILNGQLEYSLLETTLLKFLNNLAELDKIAKIWAKNWEKSASNATNLQSNLVNFVKNV